MAGIVAVLTTGGPAIAHGVQHAMFAHNADKVDGKHAVGASATVQGRKGKLVATSPASGQLPNNIIQQAPDSDLLDGLDSTSFLGAAAKAADSEQLDGLDSSELVRGGGTVDRQFANLLPGTSTVLTTALSTVQYTCPAVLTNPGSVTYSNTLAGLAPVWIDDGSSVSFTRVGVAPAVAGAAAGGDHLTISALHQIGPTRTVAVEVFSIHDLTFNVCTVSIQALAN